MIGLNNLFFKMIVKKEKIFLMIKYLNLLKFIEYINIWNYILIKLLKNDK